MNLLEAIASLIADRRELAQLRHENAVLKLQIMRERPALRLSREQAQSCAQRARFAELAAELTMRAAEAERAERGGA